MAVTVEHLTDGTHKITFPGEAPVILPADSRYQIGTQGMGKFIRWGNATTYLDSEGIGSPYRFFFHKPGFFGEGKKELMSSATVEERKKARSIVLKDYNEESAKHLGSTVQKGINEELAARPMGDRTARTARAAGQTGGRRKTRKGSGKRKTRRRRTFREKI